MKVIQSPKEINGILRKLKLQGKTVGFVPTMGALHQGHLSLMQKARKDNQIVVVSIFVNSAQFLPNEDFKRYPRPKTKDLRLCKNSGVDFVFYPSPEQMYPAGFSTYINVEGLSQVLCGKSRPGHFRGVTTIVAKLFNIIDPDIAYFGQKDAQQAVIIKKMAADLNMPLAIKIMPTIREKDGLALSSRNMYLNEAERIDATVLFDSLTLAGKIIEAGEDDALTVIRVMEGLIHTKKTAKIDYAAIVDLGTLSPVKNITLKKSNSYLIALAVWFGKTRLIDNMIIGTRLDKF